MQKENVKSLAFYKITLVWQKQTLVCWITSNSSSLVSLTLSGSGLATPLRTQVTHGIKLIFESPLSRSSAILREKNSGILNNWKLFYLRLLLNPNWTKVRLQLKYFLFIFLHTGSNLSVSALPHQSKRFQNKYCGDLTKRRFILCYGLIKLQKFVNY